MTRILSLLLVLMLSVRGEALAQEPPTTEGYPLTLDDVLVLAFEKNLDIAVERLAPRIQEAILKRERSIFDTTLNFDGNYNFLRNPTASVLSGATVIRNETVNFNLSLSQTITSGGNFNLSLNNNRQDTNSVFTVLNPSYSAQALLEFTQPLFKNFGGTPTKRQIRLARNNISISQHQFQQRVMDILLEVEDAYWDLRFRRENLRSRRLALRLAQQLLVQTQARIDVGTAAQVELAAIEASVAARHEEVILAENELANAEDTLRELLNVEQGSPLWRESLLPLTEPVIAEPAFDVEEGIETALAQRPEIRQAQVELENSTIDTRYQKNQIKPQIDLVATYGFNGLDGDLFVGNPFVSPPVPPMLVEPGGYSDAAQQIADQEFEQWSLGLRLNLPFRNREAAGQFVEAKTKEEQARLTLDDLRQSVSIEVETAFRQLKTDYQRIQAAQANRTAQEVSLEAEEKKFENGMSTSLDVLQVQDNLTNAEANVTEAQVQYEKDLSRYYRSLGTLLEQKSVSIE